MNAQEIRDICIDSAKSYYDYLSDNGKGIQEIEVYELEHLQSRDAMIKLRLSSKLFDTEAIFFKLLSNGVTYDTGQVKVVEYDSDKNLLLIKPGETTKAAFAGRRASDIRVISDLKFLVERIRLWYEANGANLSIPATVSTIQSKFNHLSFLEGLTPSPNQTESLSSIFHHPFTYVWGAPGTGKTQFVLAYALLHYIRNGKKIAILAPTNNAIEQVLRGVLKMTDKAGIERNKLLRLGTPSKKFAEEYPEVCEEKGVQKKLEEVDKRIHLLERIISYEKKLATLNDSGKYLVSIGELGMWKVALSESKSKVEAHNRKLKAKEIDIQYNKESQAKLNKELQQAIDNIQSIGHKIKKLFSSSTSKQEHLVEEIKSKQVIRQKDGALLRYDLEQLKLQEPDIKRELEGIENHIKLKIALVQQGLGILSNLASIVAPLSLDNYERIKSSLAEAIETEKDSVEIDGHLMKDYQHYSLQQLQAYLEEAKAARNKMGGTSTEDRLNHVNVVACTLDGYVGRYTDVKLMVDHIFLDEAGYANIIKALTLFNNKVPITFLGDHKQLPPVCEINDYEMERDTKYQNMFLWAQSAIYLEPLFHSTAPEVRQQYLKNYALSSQSLKRTALNSTFRFGSNLAKVLGRHVYDEHFTSSNEKGETQILYTHATKVEGSKSRISINEVSAIQKIIQALGHEDYVILAPYTKQIKLLGQHLPHDRNNLRILTVHGSQGREWKTVILSVVDTHDKWFVDTTIPISKGLNLVNTAVSRAKEQLIIVCDNHYWKAQRGQLITDLMSEGEQLQVSLYQ